MAVVAHVHNSLSAMAIGSVLPIEKDMELQQQQWFDVTNVDIENDDDQGKESDELITISYKFLQRKQTAKGDVNPKWTIKEFRKVIEAEEKTKIGGLYGLINSKKVNVKLKKTISEIVADGIYVLYIGSDKTKGNKIYSLRTRVLAGTTTSGNPIPENTLLQMWPEYLDLAVLARSSEVTLSEVVYMMDTMQTPYDCRIPPRQLDKSEHAVISAWHCIFTENVKIKDGKGNLPSHKHFPAQSEIQKRKFDANAEEHHRDARRRLSQRMTAKFDRCIYPPCSICRSINCDGLSCDPMAYLFAF